MSTIPSLVSVLVRQTSTVLVGWELSTTANSLKLPPSLVNRFDPALTVIPTVSLSTLVKLRSGGSKVS